MSVAIKNMSMKVYHYLYIIHFVDSLMKIYGGSVYEVRRQLD